MNQVAGAPVRADLELAATVPAALDAAVLRFGDGVALLRRAADGSLEQTSWRAYRALVREAAAGLIELGVAPGSGVAIHSANRPEWAIADLAAITAGAIPTGLFVTTTAEQCGYVLAHAEVAVAVADGPEAAAKLDAARTWAPGLHTIVLFDGASDLPGVVSWRELVERGRAALASGSRSVDERIAAQRPDDVATLIYTSGTTGTPKGVELTHRNLVWTAAVGAHEILGLQPTDSQLSYLPLAHIAEQMLTIHLPIAHGGRTLFVPALDQVPEALRAFRPTLFFGVPRVWEKLQGGVEKALAEAPALRRKLLGWARGKALAAAAARERGAAPPATAALADRIVLSKVRAKLGFDRVRHAASAAAPIARGTLDFFFSLGLPIYEIYGLSETSGPGTIAIPSSFRIGTVGRVMNGVELRIAEDGEIAMRGPNIFRGYRRDPEATGAVLSADGWFATGDVGELDADGYLRITDRKKELLVTSGGKKLAPAPIESRLRELVGVGHAFVVGERRHYVGALLTIDSTRLSLLAERAGSGARTLAEAAACPRIRNFFELEIERVNGALARYESVRRFALLATEFTVDGGELTPTMKLKRRTIVAKYSAEIESLYDGAAG